MKIFKHIHHDFPQLTRIDSDGGRLYQTPSGHKYPSVTTIVGQQSKQAIAEWRKKVGHEEASKITRVASRRGTNVHSLCEKYLLNENPNVGIENLEVWQSMSPYLDCIDEIHALEQKLYSNHLRVAGTVDCVARYNGKLAIIDFKTSRKVKKKEWISGYFMQCSAYAVMFEELTGIPVPNLVVLMGVDQEGCFVFEEKRDTWIDEFIKLREQYKEEDNVI